MADYEENSVGGRKQRAATALMVVLALGGIVASIAVFLQLMKVAACSGLAAECDYSALGVAMWLTPTVLAVTFVGSLIALLLLRRSRRRLWWIPALACVLTLTACVVGSALIDNAITT